MGEEERPRSHRSVAYLEGLARGLDLESEGPRGVLLAGLVEGMARLERAQEVLRRRQAELDRRLAAWGAEEDEGAEEAEVEMVCHRCGSVLGFEAALLEEEDLELTCPTCGAVVYAPGDQLVDEEEEAPAPAGEGRARRLTVRSEGGDEGGT